ncbi:MAG TPA: prenyltransferase/squalene oxidase repeat-containing protein [Tepidisphaeraceae bacterium]|jgi:hypothetical protein
MKIFANIIALLGLGVLTASAIAQSSPLAPIPNQVRGDELTPAAESAIRTGLSWLATRQQADGSFGTGGGSYGATSAITSLSAIAFMEAGNLPSRGKYAAQVTGAVKYITHCAQESGLLCAEPSPGPMYSHGFATLFLGEVYGMSPDPAVHETLENAVKLIERTQNADGGWRYMPVPFDADISVTIAQVMALRAARDAGVQVDKKIIDNAIAYVRHCQNPDGGFSYMANMNAPGGGGGSAFERSAAGVAALYYAGVFQGNDLKHGLDYVFQFRPRPNLPPNIYAHYFYGQYYAAQAMFLAGGNFWATWYPAVRDELISRQDHTLGNWSGEVSNEYCTAVALIVMQMPNRYLPVFSGKGPGD